MAENANTKNGANCYEKFQSYLEDLLASYTKLAELLSQKLVAIANFNIEALDSIIKEEQVFVLLARGFDTSLQSYRDTMELKGATLGEVINEMPAQYQPGFQAVFVKLKSKLDEVRLLNEKCQSLIGERLYRIEHTVNRLNSSAKTPYAKPGSASKPGSGSGESHILHKSV